MARHILLRSSLAVALCLVLAIPLAAKAQTGGKKLIYDGWGIRDTAYVRDRWREMEEMPFDGTAISVVIDRDKPVTGKGSAANKIEWNIFGPRPLRLDHFRGAVADLQAAKFKRFTDNFLHAAISSSGQDHGFNWFDDGRWKIILNNWRVLVSIAKQGGLRGIILDPEDYGVMFFSFPEMSKREKKSFPEYVEKARQRGREVMKLTREIFPDITIFCFNAYPVAWNETWRRGKITPVKPSEGARYGLYPAFLDGMLEEASPKAVLVDGYGYASLFKRREEFAEARDLILNKARTLSAVPKLYAQHVRAGFGLRLDYSGEKEWGTTDFSFNYFRPGEFEQALKAALELSDRYVWLYSEAVGFFPPARLPDAYLQAIKAGRIGG